MRFIDEAIIRVKGGHGGKGCVSFRREKYVPHGGPDGGDGGDGGDVIFLSSSQLSTLQDFRIKRTYFAPNGQPGQGSNKAGKDGRKIEIRVPVGTLIKDAETDEILFDFTEQNQKWISCKGGRGGKGNAHFKSSTHQAPKFSQPGEEGEMRVLKLELKLLADVGILGFPNVGKSTLISTISSARPKISDYPFTTLTPNLGVVNLSDDSNVVVADIPGLIEGAHRGVGLGHRFLKHVERTHLLLHMLDVSALLETASATDQILKNYKIIRKELKLFNADLLKRNEIIVLNKIDLFEKNSDIILKTKEILSKKIGRSRKLIAISAHTGEGISELLNLIKKELHEKKHSPLG